MNIQNPITTTIRTTALVGAFSLIALSTTQAAFVSLPSNTPETPPYLLGLPTNLAGDLAPLGALTILDTKVSDWVNGFSKGTLTTQVVDRDPGAGVLLDFYYQVVNIPDPLLNLTPDDQIYRMVINNGFPQSSNPSIDPVSVAYTQVDPATGVANAALKAALTADRDEPFPNSLENGSVGFDFSFPTPVSVDDPLNIAPGQTSSFLIVRTNTSQYQMTTADVVGGGNSRVGAFAPVPEPSSVIFGLAMFGVTLGSRFKTRRAKSA